MSSSPGRLAALRIVAALAATAPIASCDAPTSGPVTGADASAAATASADGYVRIERGAHPLARAEFDLGPLDPNQRLSNLAVVFKLSPQQESDRDALATAQLDRASPDYHKWLTPEQYAVRFGAKAADIARTRSWLAGEGLEVRSTSPLGARVNFAGRVADVETAFRTEMHRYAIGGEIHYAMSTAPAVPADLANVVLAVHNTHDFYPRSSVRVSPITQAVCPVGDPLCQPLVGPGLGLDPHDWANIYDVTPLYTSGVAGSPLNGSGITIAIVGTAQIAQSDISAFRAQYGLSAPIVTMTQVPDTGPATPGSSGAPGDTGLEGILDTEWSGGIAPGARVDYVFTGSNDPNLLDATLYAIEQNVGAILSESAGRCEADLTPSDADVIAIYGTAANLLGITYVAASGDSAATSCLASAYAGTPLFTAGLYVSEPASFPGITAVGGTEFLNGTIAFDCNGVATGYATPERVWNETALDPSMTPVGGGGGISLLFSRPSYQNELPTCAMVGSLPTNVTPSSMRQVPDVALTAAAANTPYFVECTPVITDAGFLTGCSSAGGNPQLIAVGGTSASTPSFAGVLALVNQATGGRLGNVNPQLYSLSTTAPSSFHDITTGSNLVKCKPGVDMGCPESACPDPSVGSFCYGYQATAGYDCASGLGAIDAANLVRAWTALTPTAITLSAVPSTISEGASVNLTATIASAGASASALGGTVTFVAQSYGAIGTGIVPGGVIALNPIAYALGSAPVAGASASGAMATFATGSPPALSSIGVGLIRPGQQYVDVSAAYGGDPQHLGSTSATVRVSFTGVDFCIPRATETVRPDGAIAYSASGGAAPIQWGIGYDSTCDEVGDCSTIDATSGAFTAGPEPGYVIVEAIDSDGAVAIAFVTAGDPGGTPPWGTLTPTSCAAADGGSAQDAAGPAVDATAATPEADAETADNAGAEAGRPSPCDGGANDAGSDQANRAASSESAADGPGRSGCSCRTAARGNSPDGAAFGAVLLGFGLMVRRARRRPGPRRRCATIAST